MEKLEMTSMDNSKKIIELLKTHFPGVITEMKDKDGKMKKGINFGLLRQQLSIEATDETERYEFSWIGKSAAVAESQTPTHKTLRPLIHESKDWSTTENLYIEGDNLDVLKLLQKSYDNRIKMIYIDPPYNTGNDFIYRDDYSLNVEECEEHMEKASKETILTQYHARFHSGWCSMMYPRLRLARNLLTEDGILFISIDENELDNLKKICSEIFGENNFITIMGLEITKTQGMKVKSAKEGSIVKNYEYVLCYAKNTTNKKIVKNILFDRNEGYDTHFSYYIEKLNGKYVIRRLVDVIKENNEIFDEFKKYQLVGENGRLSIGSVETAISVSGKIRNFLYSLIAKNVYQEMACAITIDPLTESQLDKGKIIEYKGYLLTKSSGGKLRQYSSLIETLKKNDEYNSEYGRVTIRGNLWKGFYSDMMNVAKEGEVEYKNGKKPVRLIYQLAKWIGVQDDDIVLDFFSGSATTAHAVMELNAHDLGHRKYIMVQLDENLDDALKTATGENKKNIQKTIAFLDNVEKPHFLSELGKQRILKSGARIAETLLKEYKGKELSEERPQIDTGFRVFQLDSSNLTEEYYTGNADSSNLKKACVREARTDMDLFYGILLDLGLPLTLNYIKEDMDGVPVYRTLPQGAEFLPELSTINRQQTLFDMDFTENEYSTGDECNAPTLMACFADIISKNVFLRIAKRQPDYAVFKANSVELSDKSAIEEIFTQYAPAATLKVI